MSRTYFIVTAAIFGLVTLAHVWRIIEEGPHLARDPFFMLITVAAAALCLWACRVLWGSPRS